MIEYLIAFGIGVYIGVGVYAGVSIVSWAIHRKDKY